MTALPLSASGEAGLARLQDYLRRHIPVSAAMGVEVREISDSRVRLWAPFEPNVNHQQTIFGGSAAAIAILAGWCVVHLGLDGDDNRVVIQKAAVEFSNPIVTDFDAVGYTPSSEAWSRFSRTLARRGKARAEVTVVLESRGKRVGGLTGSYVVLSENLRTAPGSDVDRSKTG